MTGAERFPQRARVRRPEEIRSLSRSGEHRRHGPLDFYLSPSPAEGPRVGIVVPAYQHSRVARNRVKRRLRELARREWLPAAQRVGLTVDLLVRARRSAYEATFAELRDAFLSLALQSCRGVEGG